MKSEHEKKLQEIKKLNEVMWEEIESVSRKNKKIITDGRKAMDIHCKPNEVKPERIFKEIFVKKDEVFSLDFSFKVETKLKISERGVLPSCL